LRKFNAEFGYKLGVDFSCSATASAAQARLQDCEFCRHFFDPKLLLLSVWIIATVQDLGVPKANP